MASKLNLQAVYVPARLANDLLNIKQYPLTVLEAPSGFGKTTALDSFLAQLQTATVLKHTFFTENLQAYWQWFCTTLAEVDSVCAEALLRCGAPQHENMADICEIMADLESAAEVYIVLDNLSAAAEGLPLLLTALASHTAEGLHIVACVQSSGAKTGYMLCDGKAYYIGAADFTFLKEDCRAYFAAAGLVLTDNELTELLNMTDGWIFAVYLQLLFYAKNKRFEKGILNSLIEKAFFEGLTEEEQRFYVSLSLFKSFTLRQAADVSGQNTDFVRAHLGGGFIHYDAKKQEYYFHHLLQSYLGEVFHRQSEAEQKRLCLVAADWEAAFGENINAIRLYYLAGAYEKIFAMPHTSYDLADIGDSGTRRMIFDILEKTPYEVKLRHPESMVPLAFILFFINEIEKMAETVGEIMALVEACDLPQEKKNAILGETELLISFTEYNDIAAMSRHHRKAYDLLGKRAALINMRSTWTFGSPSVMCLYHRSAGSLNEELHQMDDCMPYYYRLTGGHGNGAEFAMRAEAEWMRGNLSAAETMAHRAMFEAQSKKQSSVLQCGLFMLACIALQRGDEAALFDAAFAMNESAAANTEDMCRYTLSLFTGYINAYTHRTDKVDGWLAEGDIDETRLAPMTMPFAHIIYGKVLLERGTYEKLLAFCPFAANTAAAVPSVLPQIYFHIYASCAHAALQHEKEAEAELQSALGLALADAVYMPFAQNYARLRPMLDKLAPFEGYDTICRLGAAFEKSAAQIGLGRPKLSPREREVATLIQEGLTNKQIAARLYISISTVKMTISNIFDKTGIKSRTQIGDAKL